MTLLDRSRSATVTRLRTGRQPDLHALGLSAGWGVASAFAGALIVFVPVFVAWVAEARTSTDWLTTLSFSSSIWTLAHRAHLSVDGDVSRVVAAPLLLTFLAVVLSRVGAKAALSAEAEETGARWWLRPAAFVLGYVAAGVALTMLAMTGAAAPKPLSVLPGLVAVPLIGMAWALVKHADWAVARELVVDARERLPMTWLRAIRPALEGAGLLFGAGLLVVIGLVAMHAGRMGSIDGQIGATGVGSAVLWLGQICAVPNIALYGAAWLTGGGVTLGTVTIGATSVKTGVLPMIPMLGATPQHIPGWMAIAPIVPVLVGAFIGWRAIRNLAPLSSWRTKAEHAAAAATLSALALLAAMWAASMGVGDKALAYIGAQPLVIPLLVVELVVPAVATAYALHWWRARHAFR